MPSEPFAPIEKDAIIDEDRQSSERSSSLKEQAAAANPEEEDDENVEYPKAWKLAVITLALCLSVFCMALDNTIIATAIPRITDQFNSVGDVGWYGS